MESHAVWTVEESRAHDNRAQEMGVNLLALMETAGARAAYYLLPELKGHGLIIAGKGHNGGDALVMARHLARYGDVQLLLPFGVPKFPGAEELLKALQNYGAKIVRPDQMERALSQARWVVDGLFGTGFHGNVEDRLITELWRRLSQTENRVYALDILSGIDANTGSYGLDPVYAYKTLSFGAAKWGHFSFPGSRFSGQLVILDIGLPDLGPPSGQWLDPLWAKMHMPPRDFYAHKYRRGRVAVIGGSPSMPGAPVLAGLAALKTGAGLVELFVPRSIVHRVQAPTPLLVRGVGEGGNMVLTGEDVEALKRADVVIIGPGLGTGVSPALLETVMTLGKPLVIDADALSLLKEIATGPLPEGTVLTPHSGEMARLLGTTAQAVDAFRYQSVKQAVDRYQACVVLKGPYSLISRGPTFVNTANTPALATAGSGDVLSGIIAALLAGRYPKDVTEMTALATYLHGWAGIHAEREHGLSVIATDIIAALGQAWDSIVREEQPPMLPERF
ncbi:NAD(P)H-hydrate dehydratase [Sulfobacillus thermosulfidooxidans]|uniref:NAD(P)H-hydrate dehydratase n=1 Tax=Sulfobacillus thermosulfidooxidans TaxID=28034 RepID=UPI000B00AEA8|nr:NAD(P)H-hydrate dehydratase [Sulfobacillus thermosulfidooxidans]